MSHWHDWDWREWARSVVEASVEQTNKSEIKQDIDQTVVQQNEQTNAVVIGDDNDFDDDVDFVLVNDSDQDADQDADNDADVDQSNFAVAVAIDEGINIEERGPGDVFG